MLFDFVILLHTHGLCATLPYMTVFVRTYMLFDFVIILHTHALCATFSVIIYMTILFEPACCSTSSYSAPTWVVYHFVKYNCLFEPACCLTSSYFCKCMGCVPLCINDCFCWNLHVVRLRHILHTFVLCATFSVLYDHFCSTLHVV